MSGIDYDALREAAEAATPGPWWDVKFPEAMRRPGNPHIYSVDSNMVLVATDLLPMDAEFIGACGADVLLALLDELAAAKETARLAEESEVGWRREADELAAKVEAGLAALKLTHRRGEWQTREAVRAALEGSDDDRGKR